MIPLQPVFSMKFMRQLGDKDDVLMAEIPTPEQDAEASYLAMTTLLSLRAQRGNLNIGSLRCLRRLSIGEQEGNAELGRPPGRGPVIPGTSHDVNFSSPDHNCDRHHLSVKISQPIKTTS